MDWRKLFGAATGRIPMTEEIDAELSIAGIFILASIGLPTLLIFAIALHGS